MRRGPREAASWRRAAIRVRSTGPWLPPRASATATGRRLSDLLVELLLFLLHGPQVRLFEVRLHQLVLDDGDRLLLFDLERLDDLGLAAAAGSLTGGRLRVRAILLVGAALRAEGLGFAEIVEFRAAVVARVFRSKFELRHCRLHPARDRFSEGGNVASVRERVNGSGREAAGRLSLAGPLSAGRPNRLPY